MVRWEGRLCMWREGSEWSNWPQAAGAMKYTVKYANNVRQKLTGGRLMLTRPRGSLTV